MYRLPQTTKGGPGFNLTPPADAHQANTLFSDGTMRPFFDSDDDGISDYTELQHSDSPSLKLPRGEKEFCPDILYGCGARSAERGSPPRRRPIVLARSPLVWSCSAWQPFDASSAGRPRAERAVSAGNRANLGSSGLGR